MWASVDRWDDKCTFVISIKKENFKLFGHVLVLQNWTDNLGKDSIIFISDNKKRHLARESNTILTVVEPALQWIVAGLLSANMLAFHREHWSTSQSLCGIVHTGIVVRRHFAHVHQQCLKKCQVCIFYSCCHQIIQVPRDQRDPMTVESLLCLSIFQELLESEPLEPETAFVSKEMTRATKHPNNLFDIGNLGGLGVHCLSMRLDPIFDPKRVFAYQQKCARVAPHPTPTWKRRAKTMWTITTAHFLRMRGTKTRPARENVLVKRDPPQTPAEN